MRLFSSLLLLLSIGAVPAFCAAELPAQTDHFSVSCKLTPVLPAGDQHKLRVWVPIPQNDAFQSVRLTARDMKETRGTDGNSYLYLEENVGSSSVEPIELAFNVQRKEQSSRRVDALHRPIYLCRWLEPDKLVPINNETKTLASEIIEKAHAKTRMQKARALYDYVVDTMKYEKVGTGWGRGDLQYACDTHHGNCTDFHSLFIGLCRAAEIPARFDMGLSIPQGTSGVVAGYHCWAEFYDKDKGWFPVDASEAGKHPELREYYFGHLSPDRVMISRGRDLELAPAQSGEPLNYSVFPYAEIDGKPAKVDFTFTFNRS